MSDSLFINKYYFTSFGSLQTVTLLCRTVVGMIVFQKWWEWEKDNISSDNILEPKIEKICEFEVF